MEERGGNLLSRLSKRSETGAALLEMAVTLPLFLLVLLGMCELALTHYHKVMLNHAMIRTGRWALLGNTLPGNDRPQSIKLKGVEESGRAGVPVPLDSIQVCPLTNLACGGSDAGKPGEFIRIQAVRKVRLFWIYPVDLEASAVVKNEYYF